MTLSASIVHHWVTFLIRSQSILHWRNTFRKKLILPECKGILKQVASNGEVENLWATISCVQLKRLKRLNFGGTRLEETFLHICLPWKFHVSSVSGKKVWILSAPFPGGTPILIFPNFVKFYLSFIFTLPSKVKKFKFWRAGLAEKPPS